MLMETSFSMVSMYVKKWCIDLLIDLCPLVKRLFWAVRTNPKRFYISSQQCSVMFKKHFKFSTFLFSPLEPLCIVTEFVCGGSLDKLLRSSRVQNHQVDPTYVNIWSRLTERELLRIASDVASGMSHLESKQVCSWIHEWDACFC